MGLQAGRRQRNFFPKIALRSEAIDPANNLLQVETQAYNLGDDYIRVSGNGSANAPMVFGGNGWMVRSKGLDPYKGVDAKGKIVVLYGEGFPNRNTLTRMPAGIAQTDLTGTKGTDWADPVSYAIQQGAAGIILVASPQAHEAWGQIRRIYGRGSMYPDKLREETQPINIPVMLVSPKIGDAIFAGASAGRDSAIPFAINKTVSMTTMSKAETKWTQNVVALWEGRDPVLKNEMVAIGAHYDHVGTNPNAPGEDKIYNGADDDGSGTVAVLLDRRSIGEIKSSAQAIDPFRLALRRGKRSVGQRVFQQISDCRYQEGRDTVEHRHDRPQPEAGRYQSEKQGPFGRKRDLRYRIGDDELDTRLYHQAERTGVILNLNYDYRYDDPKDTNRFFFRSDHFNYALNGIPITFWFDGVHEDYHQPGDEPQKIDYQKMEKVARTIFLTLWEVSDLPSRPAIDKQLPPELTQR